MRIGISGRTIGIDKAIEQAERAEADGFTSLWYAGGGGGDALLAAAFAGRATSRIEVGTSVIATYPLHPYVLAARAVGVVDAIGGSEPRFTLGVGPSHQPPVEGMFGLSYDRPGTHTAEYLQALLPQLRGEPVDVDGVEVKAHLGRAAAPPHPIPVLIAALGPRLLRLAGEVADGTILWMANAEAVRSHVVPTMGSGRVVAGLPVAVHDDVAEARAVAAKNYAIYGTLPNYQRILAHGGIGSPADAVLVGDEASVRAQVIELFEAGATDVWLDAFAVGDDRAASRARTMDLLRQLAAER